MIIPKVEEMRGYCRRRKIRKRGKGNKCEGKKTKRSNKRKKGGESSIWTNLVIDRNAPHYAHHSSSHLYLAQPSRPWESYASPFTPAEFRQRKHSYTAVDVVVLKFPATPPGTDELPHRPPEKRSQFDFVLSIQLGGIHATIWVLIGALSDDRDRPRLVTGRGRQTLAEFSIWTVWLSRLEGKTED